ncbi:MAG TPA: hypothetical protein VNF92_09205 [Gemmatimonadaceae bacterium]|nr:hypothetical protein [Gemmatimonadaceae bacterium]
MRSRVFRAAALTVALVFTQIAVVSGSGMCVCGNVDMGPMPGMPTTASHQHAPIPSGTHHQAPCSHPMSQSECASMTACGVPVMAVRVAATPVESTPTVTKSVMIAAAPGTVTRAPEPPPPRA